MPNSAVVIGAGMAGLAVARVLADRFERVTLVERDALPEAADFRSGVAQGRQVHVLLARGEEILERLFPGFREELLALGAVELVWGRDVRWYHFGGWKQVHDSPFRSLSATRMLIEAVVRRRLRADDHVVIRDRTEVLGLLADGDRIEGVKLAGGERLGAELVVDASGRESRAPILLEALGFPRPRESVVNAHLGYSTRFYRPPEGVTFPWKFLLIHPTPPRSNRMAAIVPVEGNRWHVVLCGVSRDYPPTDAGEYLDWTQTLASDEVYQALRLAEPISPIWGYRRTENRRRHYEELERHLEGFLALGDAVCAFNPVYGQGMSTGAIGAELVGALLDKGRLGRDLSERFYDKLAGKLVVPWLLATSEDFRYPSTEGEPPGRAVRALSAYIDRVLRASVRHKATYEAFLHVMHMVSSPAALFRPDVLLAAARAPRADMSPAPTAPVTIERTETPPEEQIR